MYNLSNLHLGFISILSSGKCLLWISPSMKHCPGHHPYVRWRSSRALLWLCAQCTRKISILEFPATIIFLWPVFLLIKNPIEMKETFLLPLLVLTQPLILMFLLISGSLIIFCMLKYFIWIFKNLQTWWLPNSTFFLSLFWKWVKNSHLFFPKMTWKLHTLKICFHFENIYFLITQSVLLEKKQVNILFFVISRELII